MKKILALVLAVAMLASFAACGAAEAEYKLGMGVSVSLDSSKDATAQADATVATVIMDKDGKIVAAALDCAQTKVSSTDVADLASVDVRTKMEKKEDYNMKGVSASMGNIEGGAEWYEQAAAFAEKMVGKTAAEIKALETKESNGHNVAVDTDLFAVCTMDITAFKDAFVKACEDAQAVAFTAKADAFKLGLAVDTNVSGSTAEAAQLYSTFAATAVDADGKVLAAIVDEIQPKVAFDEAGNVGDKTYQDTKRNLKENYNMKGVSASYGNIEGGAEWYEQAAAFCKFVVGKTAAEVQAIETKTNDHGYVVAADADLFAGCTMQVSAYIAAVADAAK